MANRKIKLTGKVANGAYALVDAQDYEAVSAYRWHMTARGYAARNVSVGGVTSTIFLHRVINNTPDTYITDHISGDKLDNRRSNLRTVVAAQNVQNMPPTRKNSSGYKGVSWHKRQGKYYAYIRVNKVLIHLGYYDTAEAAAKVYDIAAVKHYGKAAWQNGVRNV